MVLKDKYRLLGARLNATPSMVLAVLMYDNRGTTLARITGDNNGDHSVDSERTNGLYGEMGVRLFGGVEPRVILK